MEIKEDCNECDRSFHMKWNIYNCCPFVGGTCEDYEEFKPRRDKPKKPTEKQMKKKYEPTEKCTVGNILKALGEENCNEAKAHFADYFIHIIVGRSQICIALNHNIGPENFRWLLESPERRKWLRENDFIKEAYEKLKSIYTNHTYAYVKCPYCGYEFGTDIENYDEKECSKCKKIFTI